MREEKPRCSYFSSAIGIKKSFTDDIWESKFNRQDVTFPVSIWRTINRTRVPINSSVLNFKGGNTWSTSTEPVESTAEEQHVPPARLSTPSSFSDNWWNCLFSDWRRDVSAEILQQCTPASPTVNQPWTHFFIALTATSSLSSCQSVNITDLHMQLAVLKGHISAWQ